MPRLPYDTAARSPWLTLPFPRAEYAMREARVREAMAAAGLEALIVYGNDTSYASVTYLTGLTPVYGNAYAVLPAAGGLVVVMDGMLHAEPMHSMVWTTFVEDVRVSLGPLYGDAPEKAAMLAADAVGAAGRVGIFGTAQLPGVHRAVLEARCGTLVTADRLMTEARRIKSAAEISHMRMAGEAADAAYAAAFRQLEPGVEETEVAAAAVGAMRVLGGTESFTTSVVTGPRAGLKHGLPRRVAMRAGDMAFLDLGARVEGYCSDVSRCSVVGRKATGRARDLLEAGLDLYHAGLEGLRAGSTVRQMADQLARAAAAGPFAPYYYPEGFGHGIGLDLFEAPGGLHAASDIVFAEGQCIAYEPMLVVDGLGTAVVEDTLLITATGFERLSQYPVKTWE